MPAGMSRLKDNSRHVGLHVRGEALYVTINRPEARNALHEEAHCELARIFDAFVRAAAS